MNLTEWSWRNNGNLLLIPSSYPSSSLFTLCLCCQMVSWNSGSDLNAWYKWGILWGNSWMKFSSTWMCEDKQWKDFQIGRVLGKQEPTATSSLWFSEFWSKEISGELQSFNLMAVFEITQNFSRYLMRLLKYLGMEPLKLSILKSEPKLSTSP